MRWVDVEDMLRKEGYSEAGIQKAKETQWLPERRAELQERSTSEKMYQTAYSGVSRGLMNLLGFPANFSVGIANAFGANVQPENVPLTSESIGRSIYNPMGMESPYDLPTSSGGGYTILGEGARGATEGLMGAKALAAALGKGALALGQTAWETISGLTGGVSAGLAREQGYGETGQALAEMGGSMIPAGAMLGLAGAGKALKSSGWMPDIEDVTKEFESAVRTEEQSRRYTEAGIQLGQEKDISRMPLSALDEAELLRTQTGLDFPSFTVYPELRPFAKQLSRYPEIWEEMEKTRTGNNVKILSWLQSHYSELGIDPRVVTDMANRLQRTEYAAMDAAIDAASDTVDRLVGDIRSSTTTERSSKLADLVEETMIASKRSADKEWDVLTPEIRQQKIDYTPLHKKYLELKDEADEISKKWLPKSQMGEIQSLEPKPKKSALDDLWLPADVRLDLDAMSRPVEHKAPLQKIRNIRTSLLEALRGIERRAPEKAMLRRNIVRLLESIDGDDGVYALIPEGNPAKAAEVAHKAHIDRFMRGTTGKIVRGADINRFGVADGQVLSEYMRTPSDAKVLSELFPNNKFINESVGVYFGNMLLAKNPTSKSLRNALASQKTSDILDLFPEAKNRLNEVVHAKQRLETATGNKKILEQNYQKSIAAIWLGENPTYELTKLMNVEDDMVRLRGLEELKRAVGRDLWPSVKRWAQDKYWQTITGLPENATIDDIMALGRDGGQKMKARANKLDKDMARLMGREEWNKTRAGLQAWADAADWLNRTAIAERLGPKLPGEEFSTVSRFLLQTLGRFWGWQRGVVGLGYTSADRAIAVGVKTWENFGQDAAKNLIQDALRNPEQAYALSWRPSTENINKLKEIYHANVAAELAAASTQFQWPRDETQQGM